MKINNKIISNKNTYLIAEMSGNHKKDFTRAIEIIDKAKANDTVLLMDASKMGSKHSFRDGRKTILYPEEENKITSYFKNNIEETEFSVLVSNQDILENDCSILAGQYVELKEEDIDFDIDERHLVEASFGSKKVFGVNEILVHSGSYAQLMRYRLSVNDKVVYEQRSDGLIVATPTGSTAYSLSAGGPIIHPSLDVWTILPMLPQSLSSRPFVISSEEKVTIEILEGPLNEGKVCADGQSDEDVSYNETIFIKKLDKPIKLIHPKNNDFFEACREKLGWSLDISKR